MGTTGRKFKTLDVRPILAKGVEPFSQIRESINALQPGEGLSVIAPFLPSPLIEKLGSEGFESRVERQVGGGWTVHFWRDK
ncbi:MAG TPA: DUF2249 domain-containing protein [Candidatus Udaeobacter sp.]|jgi:uncharacterized protein (DUF2249 family)|nr:DUF2249 domain-containing protein [Candidatus Udaeobacter sp.]